MTNKHQDYPHDNKWRFPKPKSRIKVKAWEEYRKLALLVGRSRMASREKTIALERLEESYMWFVKSTEAIHEDTEA